MQPNKAATRFLTSGQAERSANNPETAARDAEIKRLATALSHVKQRIHNPKLPNDACYAGVAYELPDPPMVGAKLLHERLGSLPPGMSLDRINPHGNYSLLNLRYATPKQQTANRRPARKRRVEEDEDFFDE